MTSAVSSASTSSPTETSIPSSAPEMRRRRKIVMKMSRTRNQTRRTRKMATAGLL
jgi:hypothetical protein